MDAARASARAARQGARRPLGAADRADRRRQDAGRISADAGGAERSLPARRAPGRAGRERAPHALHLAAQGAGRRHRAQPRNAGRRDGAADPHRDPHRRHAGVEAPAPAPRSARHPAHHARAAGAAARLAGRAAFCSATSSRIVLDELHALVTSKRGDLLSLGLARLFRLAPRAQPVGPVGDGRRARRALRRWLVPQPAARPARADLVVAEGGAAPDRHPCSTRPSACPGPAIRRAMRSARSTR